MTDKPGDLTTDVRIAVGETIESVTKDGNDRDVIGLSVAELDQMTITL